MPKLLLLLLLCKENNLTINPNHRLTHTLHHDKTKITRCCRFFAEGSRTSRHR